MKGARDLRGRSAVVTGGASGIGRATALALASRGAEVLVLDLDGPGAEAAAAACSAVGPPAASARLDVTERAAVESVARDHASSGRAAAVLVNSAGVGLSGPFLDTTPQDWDWIIEANLRGVINVCAAFGPAMLDARDGHVVNVSSALALNPSPTEPAYSATKAAVLALSTSLRAEWRPQGVSVTAVCPGIVNTPIAEKIRFVGAVEGRQGPDDARSHFARGSRPEEAAHAILRGMDRDLPVVLTGSGARLMSLAGRMPLRFKETIRRHLR